jgi:FixJ family two-component response regulator
MDGNRPLIAIVDDEQSVRRALARLMFSAGFRARSYASGADFIDSLGSHRPDCVILDLHMPGMSGFDVQVWLKTRNIELPVVIITGHDVPASDRRALEGGAAACLRKPMDDEVLLKAVTDALSHGAVG